MLPARKRILQVLGEGAAVQLGASEQIMLHTCRDLAYGLQVAESLVVPGGDFRRASDGELRASGRLVRALGKGSALKALAEELPGLDPKLVAGVVAERPAQPGTRDGLWRDHDVDVAHSPRGPDAAAPPPARIVRRHLKEVEQGVLVRVLGGSVERAAVAVVDAEVLRRGRRHVDGVDVVEIPPARRRRNS